MKLIPTTAISAFSNGDVMQVLLFPLAFLSGSLYPISDLPTWMSVIVRANPITYAVHLSRDIVFSNIDASPAARAARASPPRGSSNRRGGPSRRRRAPRHRWWR